MNVKCKRGEISRERLPALTLIVRDKQAAGFQGTQKQVPNLLQREGGRLENGALQA